MMHGQQNVKFYVCLPFIFLMLGLIGRDSEGYCVLHGKELVADN